MFIGGVNISTPIIAENVVFVSLLTLGCYQTGRLLFDARAGLLAAIFVLGSPLLIAQFHVFMLDAPETALVAVSMWLILASEDFGRVRMAGWAGLAVGCGLLIKVPFPFFLAGIILAAVVRGGWRHWRGLAAFAAIAFLVGAPWYIAHISEFGTLVRIAGTPEHAGAGVLPPTLSIANFTWYFWSTLNSQLFAPLFALVLGGTIWMVLDSRKHEVVNGPRREFLVGGFVAWLALTLTHRHDTRYGMPLMPYLAVIGTGWLIYLPRAVRLAAVGVLALAVAANTMATTFGVGETGAPIGLGPAHGVETALVSSPPAFAELPDRIVWYSDAGYLVAGPRRDGDVPGLLRALRRNGIRVVARGPSVAMIEPDFSTDGLTALALIARLEMSREPALVKVDSRAAALVHLPIAPSAPPACTRLTDGTGVWVLRRNPASAKVDLYCPFRHPQFYGHARFEASR
jgi:4-amino-4-deoxy-L-arabinose transferase-like glycosyltransferase